MTPRRTRTARTGCLLLLAVLARLLLAVTPGYPFDVRIMRGWGRTLLDYPWSAFYARAEGADHLPGDIVLHGVLAQVCGFVGVAPESWGYGYALKLVPITGDVVLAAITWWLVRRLRPGREHRAAVMVLLSPALLHLSAVWGQWDSVSAAAMLGGLGLIWARTRWAPLAGIPLAWALLVKPPLAVPIGVGVAVFLLSGGLTVRRLTGAAAGLGVGLVTVAALCAPFGVGPAELLARVRYAADLWPATTMGAPNIWMAINGSPWGAPSDAGVQAVGVALFAALLAVVGLVGWRARRRLSPVVLACWSAAVCSYGSFMLLTRSHERYLVPAVVLLGVLAALAPDRRVRTVWVWATCGLFVSFLAINFLPVLPPASWFVRVLPFELLCAVNLGVLAALTGWPLRAVRGTYANGPATHRGAQPDRPV